MANAPTLLSMEETSETQDNISDAYLEFIREQYKNHGGDTITKDDVWHYIYGVMHAPDWREKYANNLKKEIPRLPLAENFWRFVEAGAELMCLHVGYETCPEDTSVEVWVEDDKIDINDYEAEPGSAGGGVDYQGNEVSRVHKQRQRKSRR